MLKNIATLTLICASSAALAEGEPIVRDRLVYTSNDYVSVIASGVFPDNGRGTDNIGGGIAFMYGNQFHELLSVEGRVAFQLFETGRGKGSDFYQVQGGVDLTVTPWDRRDERPITPFALIGIGTHSDDVAIDTRDDSSFAVNAGVGFVTAPVFHNVRIRGEARYTYSTYRSGYGDPSVGIGVEIPLGRVRQTLTTVFTPQATKIIETDKEVPRPFIDTDGDTVIDELDKCPDTPKGLKVDAEGCILAGQLIELRGVTFNLDETKLRPNAQSVLDVIAKGMAGQRSLQVEIAGHTDSQGSAAYNLKLSQGRADAVRAYLIDKGVSPDQLKAVGYGESQLKIKPERNPDDYLLNRRVEFRVKAR
ncbi:OmpA family protein [Nevskia sp.]|uniref:OmpA family protein n=1 Tax=Nevskia sp. TaxID=1929292 RepID=UPI0025DD1CD2|nr:OmpA family protein [Nevskia sp.]